MSYESNVAEYEAKIRLLEREAQSTGLFHSRDVNKQIKRLRRELSDYKSYFKKYFQKKRKKCLTYL